jgi:hypothetical protein
VSWRQIKQSNLSTLGFRLYFDFCQLGHWLEICYPKTIVLKQTDKCLLFYIQNMLLQCVGGDALTYDTHLLIE